MATPTRRWAGVDYYGVLGVPSDATTEDVNEAFRRLAKVLHPDRDPSAPSSERFKEITAAYQVLRDPASRRAYDRLRRELAGGVEPSSPPTAPSPRAPTPTAPTRPAVFLRTPARARAAQIGGVILAVLGIVLAVVTLLLPDSSPDVAAPRTLDRDDPLARDITLWLAAAKMLVGGIVLAVLGARRLRRPA